LRQTRLACAVLLAVPVILVTADRASADKFAGDFMAVGGGARALGMGGAFTAIANDASTIYWNPAGMSGFAKRQLLFMHSEQFGDLIDYNFASFVSPTASLVSAESEGAFGVALMHMGIDDIIVTKDLPFTDVDGDGVFEPPDDRPIYDPDALKKESNSDYALFGSFAAKTGWGRVGGSLKLLYTNTIAGYSATGIGLDLGYLYRGVLPGLDIGAKLQDITGTYLSWSSGHNEYIAPSLKLGAAYRIDSDALNGSVILAADGDVYFEDRQNASQFWVGNTSLDLHLGAELIFQDKVMVRGGFDAENPTAGAGFKIGVFGFDYAYLHHDDFEATNRISGWIEF
jgi:hypothetical protein